MKKLFYTLLLFFIFSNSTFSQKIEATWGPAIKGKGWMVGELGCDRDYCYVLRYRISLTAYCFEKVNPATGKVVKRRIIQPKKSASFLDAIKLDDSFIMFTQNQDKRNKKIHIQQQRLDLNFKPLTKHEIIISFPMSKDKKEFDFSTFGDYYLLSQKSKWGTFKNESQRYILLDKNFQLVWDKEVNMPDKKRYEPNIFTHIDSQGNLFTVAKIDLDNKSTTDNNHKVAFRLFKYDRIADKFFSEDLTLSGDKFVSADAFEITKEQDGIRISGTYSNLKDKNMGSEGMFSVIYSMASLQEVSTARILFTRDMVGQIISYKDVDKGEHFTDMKVLNVYERENGEKLFLLERQSKREIIYTDNRSSRTEYYFDHVLLINTTSQDSVTWYNIIRKNQNTPFSSHCSVNPVFYKNNLYVFFNVNLVNTKEKGMGTDKAYTLYDLHGRGYVPVCMAIDPTGKVIYNKVLSLPKSSEGVLLTSITESKGGKFNARGENAGALGLGDDFKGIITIK